jgi:hypothetical protein
MEARGDPVKHSVRLTALRRDANARSRPERGKGVCRAYISPDLGPYPRPYLRLVGAPRSGFSHADLDNGTDQDSVGSGHQCVPYTHIR